jgi:hypothetical protein
MTEMTATLSAADIHGPAAVAVDELLRDLPSRLWAVVRLPVGGVVTGQLSLEEVFARVGMTSRDWARKDVSRQLLVSVTDGEVAVSGDGYAPQAWIDQLDVVRFVPLSYPRARLLSLTSLSTTKVLPATAVLAASDDLADTVLVRIGAGAWRPPPALLAPPTAPSSISPDEVVLVFHQLVAAGFDELSPPARQVASGFVSDGWQGSFPELVETAALVAAARV